MEKSGTVEQSTTQSNAENSNTRNKELYSLKKIEGTPFAMVTVIESNECFIALGKTRLTDLHESEKEALEEIERNRWDIIASMIMQILDNHEEIKKFAKEEQDKMTG